MFLLDVTCGGISNLVMDPMIPKLTSTIIDLIKIGVPLLLIVFGMLDLGKAVIAQKEDEIKKGQQMFIKRLITAVIVFLVIFIVELVIGLVSTDDGVTDCIDCFTNNQCTEVKKTGN